MATRIGTIANGWTTTSMNCGPFLATNGDFYVFQKGSGDLNITAQSTSNPLGTWTEAANVNAGIATNTLDSLCVIQDISNANIFHVFLQTTPNKNTRYVEFDASTDTFGTDVSLYLPSVLGTTRTHVDATQRNDGDLLCVYHGDEPADMGSNYQEITLSRREGGTWTNGIIVASTARENLHFPMISVGAADQAYMFYRTGASFNYYLRAYSGANVLRTQRATNTFSPNAWSPYGTAVATRSATERCYYAYFDGGAQRIRAFDTFSDDTDPTKTQIGSAAEDNGSNYRRATFAIDREETGQPWYLATIDDSIGPNAIPINRDLGTDGSQEQWVADAYDGSSFSLGGISANIFERAGNIVYAFFYGDTATGFLWYDEEIIRSNTPVTGTGGLTIGSPSLASTGLHGIIEHMRPGADTTLNGWTDELDGTTDIYLSIDEDPPDDADYIKSAGDPVNDIYRCALTDPPSPVSKTGEHRIQYRYRKQGGGTANLVVRLIEGASTVIATWTHNGVTTDFQLATQNLTQPQKDSIGDYADLSLEFEAEVL